jgi:thymidine kinase
MFGGKSEEMVSRARRAALANKPTLIVKFRGDDRYERGDVVATHADVRQASTPGSAAAAPIRVVSAATLASLGVPDEDVIGIDEGQFYPDLLEVCEQWAAAGKRVIVAALDGDFLRRPFGQVCELVPRCESVEKKRGVCMVCRDRDSSFTQRLSESTALVEIGAQESYRSVCRQCYFHRESPVRS